MATANPTIGIITFENAEELDFVGPWEVLTMAKKGLDTDPSSPAEDLGVYLIAQTLEPVRCAKGLRVLPDATFDDAPELDVLLVPGGEGTRREVENPLMLDYLRKAAPRCEWVTSVCTGSLLLHGAGLTSGRRITTHWAFVETLRGLAADATVLDGVRYVRDGNLVTAAGVSAGIDMALWLVGQIWDVEHARQTQRFMEYDPTPPYSADAADA
jgi:transcriptional regulator GlxA family with amidase domain